MATYTIELLELILALANAADLVSPDVASHHKRVAYITDSLATELGLPLADRNDAVVAAALHDLGAFSLQERLNALEFEVLHPHRHAELGYRMLGGMRQFGRIADIIRAHHVPWEYGYGTYFNGREVSPLSHLLHLADRVDVLIKREGNVLHQAGEVIDRIVANRGSWFVPEYVDALLALAGREYFWLDAASLELNSVLRRSLSLHAWELDTDNVVDLAKLLSHLIDYKSPYTSTHTAGVAACAAQLARLAGFDGADCQRMRIAGYLHDVGKLAVPTEVLEKPARLEEEEFNLIKVHAYYTRRIVESISDFGEITDWAADHHEQMSGEGYPYHRGAGQLSTGSRIMSVADVFTALTENRPYRAGMPPEQVRQEMKTMATRGKLDHEMVDLLLGRFDDLNEARELSQQEESTAYTKLMDGLPVAGGEPASSPPARHRAPRARTLRAGSARQRLPR